MPEQRLRFCFVTTFYPPFHFGGDAVFVRNLARELARRGHEVDVVHSVDAYRVLSREQPAMEAREQPGIRRLPLETSRPWLAALSAHQTGGPGVYGTALRAILEEGHYDVIHYHNVSLVGGPGVLRLGDAVKLYTAHEYWLVCPTHVLFTFDREACVEKKCVRCTLHAGRPPQAWRYTGLLDRSARHVDRFLFPTRFARDRHAADGLEGDLEVLPLFVPRPTAGPHRDASAAAPDGGSALPQEWTEEPFFLFVGRLEKLKGLQDVIPVFADLPDCRLLVAGDGAYGSTLRRQAADLPNVRFLGRVEASTLDELYRRAVALLAPSLCYEVFGLTLAEALVRGTPVVARRIGALTELVENSGGGLLFDDRENCLRTLRRLLEDRQMRDDLATRGRRHALATWTPEPHLDRYLRLVRELSGSGSGPATRRLDADPEPAGLPRRSAGDGSG